MPHVRICQTLGVIAVIAIVGCGRSEPSGELKPSPTETNIPAATATVAPVEMSAPKPTITSPTDALFDYTLAFQYLEQGLWEDAIPQFSLVIRKLPDLSKAWRGRGIAYFHEERYNLAMEDLNRAIELDPGYPDPYKDRALVNEAIGEKIQALDDLSSAISLYDPLREARKLAEARDLLNEWQQSGP